jgi:hypothetical protein
VFYEWLDVHNSFAVKFIFVDDVDFVAINTVKVNGDYQLNGDGLVGNIAFRESDSHSNIHCDRVSHRE